MINKGIDRFSIRHQCDLLNISRSGLYYTPSAETG